ncbi:universal stress protein [Streptomyces decoyicus]|uniref:universal stress protein n=1 Tax=Streptomyces decoyicus TaxID=249567 RepID=UPI0004AA64C6|nr:universal stress protein [Streptomyces decoyicus]KOG41128.1 universal stress protein UspA [Streptomyces decoyicus]QZY20022.1 universal stress protein [Streptomyces decoyicus]
MSGSKTSSRPVLVGVEEESDAVRGVVRHAARQAELHGNPLHLLHVFGGSPSEGASGESSGRTRAKAQDAAVVEPLAAWVHSEFPNVAVTAQTTPGRAAEELLARSAEAATLVLGHRGTGGFARLPLGSVSWQVATHAACPVVIVRPGETAERPEARVVVGVDINDVSEEAVDAAFAEAALRGARLEMVHANLHLSEMPVGPGMAAPDFKALDDAARQILNAEATRRTERYPGVEVLTRVERVRPSTILAEASRRASLLVVGSHGRTGLRRLMLGSVSAEALHTAACPVMVVPTVDDNCLGES